MSKALAKHLVAIQNGAVERSNVIGLRKLLNDAWRKRKGYSVSKTAADVDDVTVCQVENLLYDCRPRVTGELHDSGVTVLQNKRHKKKVAPYADIVADIERFELVAFDEVGRGNHVPLYLSLIHI